MPRHPLPVRPKGSPRTPGSGRQKGTLNPISVEVRELVAQLVTDPRYQLKLRQDFQQRRVHPTMESLIWTYHLGKPRQDVHLTGAVDVSARLEEERHLFAQLDVRVLEGLAAESQALVDKAAMLARQATATVALPQHVVSEVKADAVDQYTGNEHPESLGFSRGSDNDGYGYVEEGKREDDADAGGEG